MDDTLCASVGAGMAPATARAWVHQNTIVLGIQDTKLPFLGRRHIRFERKGLRRDCRNSGGLAVVLDEGFRIFLLSFRRRKKGLILIMAMMRCGN